METSSIEKISPPLQDGGEARSTGGSSPQIMSREGTSGDFRLGSRGVAFSSPESAIASPHRWTQGTGQNRQRQTSQSTNGSPTRNNTHESGRQDAEISINGKGENCQGQSQQSIRSVDKSDRAWRREKHR